MKTSANHAVLLYDWDRLMRCLDVPDDPRSHPFTALLNVYSEPHRHYHNLDHIASMLSELQFEPRWQLEVSTQVMLLYPVESEIVELATWYHDVVYDSRSSENEFRSAEFARNSLRELHQSGDLIKRVCDLILMTRNHLAPKGDTDAALFLDADLSVLAAPAEYYAEYSKAIRMEYAWMADRDFYQGRREILQGFLQRPKIYHEWFTFDREKVARANIAAEIAQIDEILGTLAR